MRVAVVAGCLLLLTATAPAQETPAAPPTKPTLSLEELFGDELVAKGAGLEIRQSELDRAFLSFQSNLAARGQRINPGERTVRQAMLLDRMIVTHLLTNRATKMDRSLAAASAERFYTDTKQAAGSDENFLRQLKVTGLTPEEFNDRILEQAIAESVLERELADVKVVSDEEVKAFYDEGIDLRVRLLDEELVKLRNDPQTEAGLLQALQERREGIRTNNLDRLQSRETVTVAHVLISTRYPNSDTRLPEAERLAKREEAERVLTRAQGGEDFNVLVKAHSDDRNLETTGGIYTLSREDPFPPEFVAASFSLEKEQISDVVESRSGFHIIKLLDTTPASKRPLAELDKEIRDFLSKQKMQRAMPEFFARIKKEAGVEIVNERYRSALEQLAGRTGFETGLAP